MPSPRLTGARYADCHSRKMNRAGRPSREKTGGHASAAVGGSSTRRRYMRYACCTRLRFARTSRRRGADWRSSSLICGSSPSSEREAKIRRAGSCPPGCWSARTSCRSFSRDGGKQGTDSPDRAVSWHRVPSRRAAEGLSRRMPRVHAGPGAGRDAATRQDCNRQLPVPGECPDGAGTCRTRLRSGGGAEITRQKTITLDTGQAYPVCVAFGGDSRSSIRLKMSRRRPSRSTRPRSTPHSPGFSALDCHALDTDCHALDTDRCYDR